MSTLLVAATGGHLKQLHRLRPRLWDVKPPFTWATFDVAQSRSLLAGEVVDYVGFVGSREPVAALRQLRRADSIIRRRGTEVIVSTGSGIAVPFFIAGRLRGLRCIYVESAARSTGPSLTGRIVSAVPGAELFTQYPGWADGRWRFRQSVFDGFAPSAGHEVSAPLQVLVTLGTLRFDFSRLVRRLLEILPPDAVVTWQLGSTDGDAHGVDWVESMPDLELSRAMREADVVVAHSGVGSALGALEAGKVPILVPRRLAHDEHIDDHQEMIAAELSSRGLALSVEADELDLAHLRRAAALRVSSE